MKSKGIDCKGESVWDCGNALELDRNVVTQGVYNCKTHCNVKRSAHFSSCQYYPLKYHSSRIKH